MQLIIIIIHNIIIAIPGPPQLHNILRSGTPFVPIDLIISHRANIMLSWAINNKIIGIIAFTVPGIYSYRP